MLRFERHGDRSAWKDCTELENEHEIGLRASKTSLGSTPNATRLNARNAKALGRPDRNGEQRANAREVKGSKAH